jgi:hypothetical protein
MIWLRSFCTCAPATTPFMCSTPMRLIASWGGVTLWGGGEDFPMAHFLLDEVPPGAVESVSQLWEDLKCLSCFESSHAGLCHGTNYSPADTGQALKGSGKDNMTISYIQSSLTAQFQKLGHKVIITLTVC